MAQELKTKSMPAHWLHLAYFDISLEYIWSASECLWMTSDDIGVSPTNGRYTPRIDSRCFLLTEWGINYSIWVQKTIVYTNPVRDKSLMGLIGVLAARFGFLMGRRDFWRDLNVQ